MSASLGPSSFRFAAAQAAQKSQQPGQGGGGEFAAAQAAQKIGPACFALGALFAAAQAAQKVTAAGWLR